MTDQQLPDDAFNNLAVADAAFADCPNTSTAGNLLAAAMEAEADGTINDEAFLDYLVTIRDYLQE